MLKLRVTRFIAVYVLLTLASLREAKTFAQVHHTGYDTLIHVGAARFSEYLPLVKDKKVALLVNQTSRVGAASLLDTLLQQHIVIKKIFAPEHGFRGDADAGATVANGTDSKTGIAVISLYGDHNKPTADDLKDIDVLVFDIQDVGARFYTFISTMSLAMEACAENKKLFIVLDRPNPNGFYVDGPVDEPGFRSFVGMHAVPVVHGMTTGEYAQMLNGEHWLKDTLRCNLRVIHAWATRINRCISYRFRHHRNLPNMTAVYLYPSLCFFEGCKVSVGRGTSLPFQVVGYPDFPDSLFYFTPEKHARCSKSAFPRQKMFGLQPFRF